MECTVVKSKKKPARSHDQTEGTVKYDYGYAAFASGSYSATCLSASG